MKPQDEPEDVPTLGQNREQRRRKKRLRMQYVQDIQRLKAFSPTRKATRSRNAGRKR